MRMAWTRWSWCLYLAVILHARNSLTASPKHIELTLGEETAVQDLECLQWMYYKVEVTEPCKDLSVRVLHQRGEPNLYVSRGATMYPKENSLAWSSYNWGSEQLRISSWDPEFTVGTFYIGVHAYCGDDVDSGFTDARYTVEVNSIETEHPHEEITINGAVSDQVLANEYKYFRFCVPDSCNNVEVKIENCVDPATCPDKYAWPELLISRSILVPTINDHAWKLADFSRRSVMLDHDDPEFYPGHHYVGVYGWCTPDDQCNDDSSCGPCNNYPLDFTVRLVVSEVTSGCKPKQPLGLCEGGGSAAMKVSMLVLVLSTSLAGFVFFF